MEEGLDSVYVEKNNKGNVWGLMNFNDNDNGGSETGRGLMKFKRSLKKMRRRRDL